MMKYIHKRRLIRLLTLALVAGSTLMVYQNTLFRMLFPEKVWVHRVNSLKKQKDVYNSHYRGIELDVSFINGVFDVNHAPAASINLCLDTYIDKLPNKEMRLWLDFKNLNIQNHNAAAQRLDSICEHYNINKNHIIIESQNPKQLSTFAKRAYQTSYYLPLGLYKKTTLEQHKLLAEIDDLIQNYPSHYISFDQHDYHLIHKRYPKIKKLTWGFYTWGFHADQGLSIKRLLYSIQTFILKFRLLLDANVDVLLVSYNSEGGNR